MGVIYKLREEVVHFIISQRQSNPLASCRQLAESASQEFSLRLSKSSVHDVLKESGIVTPRGRKPKTKFQIPQEKKKQIQVGLSQVKLLPGPVESDVVIAGPKGESPHTGHSQELVIPERTNATPNSVETQQSPVISFDSSVILSEAKDLNVSKDSSASPQNDEELLPRMTNIISPEYEGAGRIFLKAVLWDLGIFEQNQADFPLLQERDWNYYLTYAKGIKVDLENNKSFFIDLPLPLERCIREATDGLINNVKPFRVYKVSDEELFRASMEAEAGFKVNFISIVDKNDHVLLELSNIMDYKRTFMFVNMVFVDSLEKNVLERSKVIFFSQVLDNKEFIDNILNLKGFDTTNDDENVVTLLIDKVYEKKSALQEAVEKLNGMYLRDEQDRLVSVKIIF